MSSKEPETGPLPAVSVQDLPSTSDDTESTVTVGRRSVSATSLAFLLFAVFSAAAGQVLLKHGMTLATERAKLDDSSLVMKAITSPWVILGLMVFAISAVAWLSTLSRLPLSIAYPFNALGYIGILTASAVLLGERTNLWTWVGTSFVAGGLLLVVLTKPV